MNAPEHQQAESVPVTLARLEGKLDATIAAATARTDEHGRRLDVVDTRLNAHSAAISATEKAVAAIPPPAPRTSWVAVASLVVAGVVGLGSLAGVLITLIQVVPTNP
jgi:uncharacterized protein YqjF (DUF2071 family)